MAASRARRYFSTTFATYSGPFMRPSILKQETPAASSSGSRSYAARSRGESRYLSCSSPRAVSTPPSTTRSYGIRQLWAHWPRFALRCCRASLVRHCPLQLTHSAPCTKHSSSRSDRKSTRLNSSHLVISYAVFCLKKKKIEAAHVARYRLRHE